MVLDPSGQRSRVNLDRFPFLIGRQPDNHLVLRDNRASRSHARIIPENDHYVLEDLNSRHGTWVNGDRIARHLLRNSDRIDFGVHDSYQITVSLETGKITKMLEHFATSSHSGGMGDNALAKLRSLVEVARAVHNSLSTEEVLTAVVDAALAVTGCERGFLLLRKDKGLDIAVARDRAGQQTGCCGSARAPLPDPARSRKPARTAVHVFRSAGRAKLPAGDERRRAGTSQRRVSAAGAGAQRRPRRDPHHLHGRSHHRTSVHGFARGARGSFRWKPRTAADAGHGGVHDSRKLAADGRRARQAQD